MRLPSETGTTPRKVDVKPLLLLDIDGVLCPFDTESEDLEPVPDGRYAYYNPRHGEWLRELQETYSLAWCSLWEEGGNDVLAPLYGIGDLPYIKFWNLKMEDRTLKLTPVKRFIDTRPVVWIDDDLFEDAFAWAKERNRKIPD
jgi:hypothetical protein